MRAVEASPAFRQLHCWAVKVHQLSSSVSGLAANNQEVKQRVGSKTIDAMD